MKALTPKEIFEALLAGEILVDIHSDDIIMHMKGNKLFDGHGEEIVEEVSLVDWKIKSKIVVINDRVIQAPIITPLVMNVAYYYVDFDSFSFANTDVWTDSDIDRMRLKRGLIHLSRFDAEAMAKALLNY
jgi:hypothetical protein